MAKFSITMSDDLGNYVQDEIAEKHFDNVSEYFRHLIRRERERQVAETELRSLIDEGLRSGPSHRSVQDIWADALSQTDQAD
ncbi:type II toxin-antitoxin system ParD family antitoxin [Magnetovibrio sp. PR-2]|uniref:ribbon-helix-helix domain-containing protein n=1 Tax=Magnetovibrio sp. PR-2 TaxID=3120356 RepID=UPI002FCE0125